MHPDCAVGVTVTGDYTSTVRSKCGYTLNKSPAHHRVTAGLLSNHSAWWEIKRTVPLTHGFREGFCFKSIRAAGFCWLLWPRRCRRTLQAVEPVHLSPGYVRPHQTSCLDQGVAWAVRPSPSASPACEWIPARALLRASPAFSLKARADKSDSTPKNDPMISTEGREPRLPVQSD